MRYTVKLYARVEIDVDVEADTEEQAMSIVRQFRFGDDDGHESEVNSYWLGEDLIQPDTPIALLYDVIEVRVDETEMMEYVDDETNEQLMEMYGESERQ